MNIVVRNVIQIANNNIHRNAYHYGMNYTCNATISLHGGLRV